MKRYIDARGSLRRVRVTVGIVAVVGAVTAGLTWTIEPHDAEVPVIASSAITMPQQPPAPSTPCPVTAAAVNGWGAPARQATFEDPGALDNWWLYDSVGNGGNGRRIPGAITVADGRMTITADDVGNSGGMALKGPGQIHGRWEICAKSTTVTDTYHSVLLLWPDAENWPVGGEIDFMEIQDPTRQQIEANLHYGADDQVIGGVVNIDATQWHAWAVEWTPTRITTYVDGVKWWETTDAAHFPAGRMHLAMQLDDFGGDTRGGGQLSVDWVREYRADR